MGLATALVRPRQELLLENAFLRQQVIVLGRAAKRPACTPRDRGLLVLLAGRLRTWAGALLIIQPGTVLHRHRQGFRFFWRRKSAPRARSSPLAPATIDLIGQIARDTRLWGAERIRGERLKLDIRVSKRTVQKYMQRDRSPRPVGQSWATFLRNHAGETWACDFLQVTDLLCRPLFAFFLVERGSRRVVHVGVTRHPTAARVARQLREATPYGAQPRFLVRDNDAKYGPRFARVAEAGGIAVVRTPVRAPRANAICERFPRSVRRECLDHIPILGETRLRRVLRDYVQDFHHDRPHQGPAQQSPAAPEEGTAPVVRGGGVRGIPVLGGLHHPYARAAQCQRDRLLGQDSSNCSPSSSSRSNASST